VTLVALVRRVFIRERRLLVASCREFEVASGSEFDVPTAPCNNHATPSIYDSVETEFDQEKQQELFNDVEKFLQDQGASEVPPMSHVFGSNQYPEIQISPETTENSSLAMVSEFGWSQLAKTSTVPGRAQPAVFDTGEKLAQLVAAEDPSVALISNLGWPDFYNNKQETNPIDKTWTLPVKDNGEQLLKLVAAEDPSVALVSDHGWLDTAAKKTSHHGWPDIPVENTTNPTGEPSWNSRIGGLDTAENIINSTADLSLTSYHGGPATAEITMNPTRELPLTSCPQQVHSNQTITLTLPVVSATHLEQSRDKPLDNTLLAMADEASSSVEAYNSSLRDNNNSPLDTKNGSLGTKISPITANNTKSCQELQAANYPGGEPIIEAARARPSVIVSARSSRKRAFKETDDAEKRPMVEKNAPVPILMPDLTMDDTQDEIPPALLEKRRKGNARCKKYRVNKKQKEAIEETELEMLTRRNEFLREEEKRLTDRKWKLQQSYLSLIRQKKIRFQ